MTFARKQFSKKCQDNVALFLLYDLNWSDLLHGTVFYRGLYHIRYFAAFCFSEYTESNAYDSSLTQPVTQNSWNHFLIGWWNNFADANIRFRVLRAIWLVPAIVRPATDRKAAEPTLCHPSYVIPPMCSNSNLKAVTCVHLSAALYSSPCHCFSVISCTCTLWTFCDDCFMAYIACRWRHVVYFLEGSDTFQSGRRNWGGEFASCLLR